MKQPFNGLFSIKTLKNKYLSVGIATAFLCFSLQLSAQTFDTTRKLQPVGGDGFIWKSGEFVGKMKAPIGLTPLSSKDSGSMAYANSSMNVWNGTTWVKIGTGAGGKTIATGAPDSTYFRLVNTEGRNYRIQALGVTTGGQIVNGNSNYLTPSDTLNRYPRIIAGTNISVTGTYPNLTINSSGGGGAAFDSTTIYNQLNARVRYSDTASQLNAYKNAISTNTTNIANNLAKDISDSLTLRNLINVRVTGVTANLPLSVTGTTAPIISLDTSTTTGIQTRFRADTAKTVINATLATKENSLGNPSTNGYVLSSTSTGTRSWIAPATGGGGGTVTSVSANAPLSISGGGTISPTVVADTTSSTGFQTKFRTDSAKFNIYPAIAAKGKLDSIFFNNSGLIHSPATITYSNKSATITQNLANQSPFTLLGRGTGTGAPSFLSSIDSNYAPTLATVNALNNGLSAKQPIGTYIVPTDTVNRAVRLIAGSNIGIVGTYPNITINGTASPTDTTSATAVQTRFRSDTARTNTYSSLAGKQNTLGFTPYNSTNPSGYISSYTETDPIVKAINGIVKSNGTTISAAVAGTDYLSPSSPVVFIAKYIVRETPTGSVNGTNTAFAIANTFVTSTEMVFIDGLLQEPTEDYTLSGTTLTLVAAPPTNTKIRITYIKQ